jgi:hypothetical protein
LAIITMQMMPIISWLQRVASEARSAGRSVCEIADIGVTPQNNGPARPVEIAQAILWSVVTALDLQHGGVVVQVH